VSVGPKWDNDAFGSVEVEAAGFGEPIKKCQARGQHLAWHCKNHTGVVKKASHAKAMGGK
jgi:hypothetical protein